MKLEALYNFNKLGSDLNNSVGTFYSDWEWYWIFLFWLAIAILAFTFLFIILKFIFKFSIGLIIKIIGPIVGVGISVLLFIAFCDTFIGTDWWPSSWNLIDWING
ncbi:/ / hypothetical protein / 640323:640607 Reverse [Candidatus Hepatoplasma crinochetorum]|uniref:Uncharacterized protein n=1 Tax=Candidatus Hepatoplasma crinochetorum TaxID=295596 RepID=A0A0G7ZLU6_9MOLU|nr:/ / hypothetical protein / 640323:640607 Reverse [Candidatus Hepatoplasma crinochetorum]